MDPDQLTPTQRRERLLTLTMIGIFSLLTGKEIFFFFKNTSKSFSLGIDYAIILPTAWGYVNIFMHDHYGGFVIGILLSAFALSGAIAGLIFGHLNDIGVSLKRLVLLGGACQVVGNILYFIGINIYVLVISRLIAGIGMGVVVGDIELISILSNGVFLLATIVSRNLTTINTGTSHTTSGKDSCLSTNWSFSWTVFYHFSQTMEFHIVWSACDHA